MNLRNKNFDSRWLLKEPRKTNFEYLLTVNSALFRLLPPPVLLLLLRRQVRAKQLPHPRSCHLTPQYHLLPHHVAPLTTSGNPILDPVPSMNQRRSRLYR
ncbi:hypothetical protein E2C01_055149 [Portunus trituberculatus]|uniref:Uncharacterized protein n=1 Tax=Portunus trituberculatus TaxID=210409 RepID=A0A5B7GU20_PORTR|nr:hypothetical protein [Portunus trituberculatus]